MSLFLLLAGLALLRSTIGVYGILGFAVRRRRLEFGVRMAAGATNEQIVRLVFSQASPRPARIQFQVSVTISAPGLQVRVSPIKQKRRIDAGEGGGGGEGMSTPNAYRP